MQNCDPRSKEDRKDTLKIIFKPSSPSMLVGIDPGFGAEMYCFACRFVLTLACCLTITLKLKLILTPSVKIRKTFEILGNPYPVVCHLREAFRKISGNFGTIFSVPSPERHRSDSAVTV